MLAEITAATQLVLVCNPNNPTGTHIPAERIAAFLERVPDHVTVILDEAYIEIQTLDDPDATLDLRRDFPNLVLLRTFSKVYGLAGLRFGYALCSAALPRRGRRGPPAVQRQCLAQAAAAEAIRHPDDVERRVEATIVERIRVEEGLRELGLATPHTQTNFSWIDLGDRDEAEIVEALGGQRDRRSCRDAARRPRPHPGHLRDPGREPALPRGARGRDLSREVRHRIARNRVTTVALRPAPCYKSPR